MRRLVLLIVSVFMFIMGIPSIALSDEGSEFARHEIEGKVYDILTEIGIRVPTYITVIRNIPDIEIEIADEVPGDCLILAQKWCDLAQKNGELDAFIDHNLKYTAQVLFMVDPGTPVFAPMDGVISNKKSAFTFLSFVLGEDAGDLEGKKLDIVTMYDATGDDQKNNPQSELYTFYGVGLGAFLDLYGEEKILKISKGDVLFIVTDVTSILPPEVTNLTVTRYVVASQCGEWKDVTFDPPLINE